MPRAPKYTPVAARALASSPSDLFVGTSGWAYPTWKPGFYPAEVPPHGFLHFYATHLTAVEVNYTFRALPSAEQLQGWLDATPPGFRFCFKAPQQITHFQRLRESHGAVAEFVTALAPARKAGKLGSLLFQLPPNFAADHERLKHLLAAPALRRHKLAFEFRHASWFTQQTYALLRRHRAALCIAESEDLTTPDVQTAPIRYYRLRCPGGYSTPNLRAFASRFADMARKGEVYVFFKHEDGPTGALNAVAVVRRAARVDKPGQVQAPAGAL